MKRFLIFIIVVLLVLFLVKAAYGACSIDKAGQITGAACTVEQANTNLPNEIGKQNSASDNYDKTTDDKRNEFFTNSSNSTKKQLNKADKHKNKVKKINFNFNRDLLYRNITVLWFN